MGKEARNLGDNYHKSLQGAIKAAENDLERDLLALFRTDADQTLENMRTRLNGRLDIFKNRITLIKDIVGKRSTFCSTITYYKSFDLLPQLKVEFDAADKEISSLASLLATDPQHKINHLHVQLGALREQIEAVKKLCDRRRTLKRKRIKDLQGSPLVPYRSKLIDRIDDVLDDMHKPLCVMSSGIEQARAAKTSLDNELADIELRIRQLKIPRQIGTFEKIGGNSGWILSSASWKHRYFELTVDRKAINYYKDDSKKKQQGTIDLSSFVSCTTDGNKLKIQATGDRTEWQFDFTQSTVRLDDFLEILRTVAPQMKIAHVFVGSRRRRLVVLERLLESIRL